MTYFYARVSTREQNLDRQLVSAREYRRVDEVFADKQSGKDMNRPEYQRMKGVLLAGDEVVVHALDRLGRNKEEVKREIAWYRENGIMLRILNIPTTMIDFQGQDWIGDMVTNILIEVLSSVAQQEREENRRRQEEGIAAMRIENGKRVSARTGNAIGRSVKAIDEKTFSEYRAKTKKGDMTVDTACGMLGISRSTWYARCRATA